MKSKNCLVCKKKLVGHQLKYCDICSYGVTIIQNRETARKTYFLKKQIWDNIPQAKKDELMDRAREYYFNKAKEEENENTMRKL